VILQLEMLFYSFFQPILSLLTEYVGFRNRLFTFMKYLILIIANFFCRYNFKPMKHAPGLILGSLNLQVLLKKAAHQNLVCRFLR